MGLVLVPQRVQELGEQLSKTAATSKELEVQLQAKEEELLEKARCLVETETLCSHTRSNLEREKSQNSALEQDKELAVQNHNRVRDRLTQYIRTCSNNRCGFQKP